jgi:hypothetical protein
LGHAVSEALRRYTDVFTARGAWAGELFQRRFASMAMDETHLLAAERSVGPDPMRARLFGRPGVGLLMIERASEPPAFAHRRQDKRQKAPFSRTGGVSCALRCQLEAHIVGKDAGATPTLRVKVGASPVERARRNFKPALNLVDSPQLLEKMRAGSPRYEKAAPSIAKFST